MNDILNEKTDIAKKLYKGSLARITGIIITRILSIVRLSFFARVFLPENIGLLNLTLTCVGFLAIFGNFGFTQFLIKEKDNDKLSNTTFSISFLINILLIFICLIISPLFSKIFSADLKIYIYLISIILLEIPLKLPAIFWEKKLKFGYSTLISLITETATIISTLVIELFFKLGIWSLLFGYLIGLFSSIIYIWIFAFYRPKLQIDKETSGKLFSFGTPYMVQGINGFIMSRGDNLIVAKIWGNSQLAFYNFAWQLPLIISAFVQSIDSMLLPVYAKLNTKTLELKRVFNLHNKIWAIFGTFFGFILVLYADLIVNILYGQKWLEVVPILKIMAISFIIRYSTGYGYDHLVIIRGRTKYMMKWGIINTIFLLTLGLFLIYKMGPIGGAWFWVIQCISLIPLVRFPLIYSELHTLEFLKSIWQPIVSGLFGYFISYILLQKISQYYIAVGVSLIIYFIVYFLLFFLLDKYFINDIKKIITLIKS